MFKDLKFFQTRTAYGFALIHAPWTITTYILMHFFELCDKVKNYNNVALFFLLK